MLSHTSEKNTLSIYSSAIAGAIDRHPLIVKPCTKLQDVLVLMNHVRSSCNLPSWYESCAIDENLPPEVEQQYIQEARGSYVLIQTGTKLLGIFTERDIVKLTARNINFEEVTIDEVMTKSVFSLSLPELTDIFTVLSYLRQHHIRHLPIFDEHQQLYGVLTREGLRQALQPVNLLTNIRYVADVMTRQVITLPKNVSVLEVARLMAENQVSCIVVTDDLKQSHDQHYQLNEHKKTQIKPSGIVTERDIVQFQALELNFSDTTAGDVMSFPLFALKPTDSIWFAHQQMLRHHVSRLIVTDEQDEMIGIVSQANLLQVLNPTEMYGVIELLQQMVDGQTKELMVTNQHLQAEIEERHKAELALRFAHDTLKEQVEERTAKLSLINEQLQADIRKRERVEADLRESEALLKKQTQELQATLTKLQNTQSQLIQTEKMSSLGQMIAGIAHEINNPINFIYGNLAIAQNYLKDLLELLKTYQKCYPQPAAEVEAVAEDIDADFLLEDIVKVMNSMEMGTERIKQIILSMRNFSRMDDTSMKLANIHEGIDSTLLILQNRLKAHEMIPNIQVNKEYGKLPYVECFAGQLNQVFMNIIVNAIDALEEYCLRHTHFLPQINISTEVEADNWAVITIADNGAGIEPAVIDSLFNPFFTTKPVGKGTGLGLSISYQIIVERHHGSLQCVSEIGKGTQFIIKIPIDHHLCSI
jgi:signal transduction histidine kinase/CBS domain-containing protein